MEKEEKKKATATARAKYAATFIDNLHMRYGKLLSIQYAQAIIDDSSAKTTTTRAAVVSRRKRLAG